MSEACDLQALKSSCIKITVWAQVHFQKCKLKLFHTKKKLYVNMKQKCHHCLWATVHLKYEAIGKL